MVQMNLCRDIPTEVERCGSEYRVIEGALEVGICLQNVVEVVVVVFVEIRGEEVKRAWCPSESAGRRATTRRFQGSSLLMKPARRMIAGVLRILLTTAALRPWAMLDGLYENVLDICICEMEGTLYLLASTV